MLEVDELGEAIFRNVGTIVLVKDRANILKALDADLMTAVTGLKLESPSETDRPDRNVHL